MKRRLRMATIGLRWWRLQMRFNSPKFGVESELPLSSQLQDMILSQKITIFTSIVISE
ncbi:hypothetical protein HanXRQr2_Chr07g0307661 [Helianthus annuus]|uniref:Uncharacterized protein n=1 Tax=Helianthus annuus TaxID=4232 RepID=A0A9K3IMH9_HELAN|nr:hypothetical protein HanXRQr2_Chr07g0307661 [Helianthus annuus]